MFTSCFLLKVFESGVSVLEQVCAETYDGENMTSLLSRAALNTSANENFDLSTNSARALLTKLQRTRNHLADFQFFEQVQQVPFYFPAGSSKLTQKTNANSL